MMSLNDECFRRNHQQCTSNKYVSNSHRFVDSSFVDNRYALEFAIEFTNLQLIAFADLIGNNQKGQSSFYSSSSAHSSGAESKV